VPRKGSEAAAGKIPSRTPQGKSNEDVRNKSVAHPRRSSEPGNSGITLKRPEGRAAYSSAWGGRPGTPWIDCRSSPSPPATACTVQTLQKNSSWPASLTRQPSVRLAHALPQR
jgi:hypothetical protein